MKKETSCGSVIFAVKDGVYYTLLTKNLKGCHWSFPKGHVEVGETRLQTAKREVLEETGLHIEPISGYLDCIRYRVGSDIEKTVWYYASMVPHDVQYTPQPEEVSAIKWVAYPQALDSLTYKRDAELLKRAYDFVSKMEKNNETTSA